MSAKSAFQILTGLHSSVWSSDFPFGGTLGETFEAFAIESDLRLSRRKDPERLLKIWNNRLVAFDIDGQFVCEARCNLQHFAWRINWRLVETWIWISRDPAKALRPRDLKIDSGEKSFPLEVANQLARYF